MGRCCSGTRGTRAASSGGERRRAPRCRGCRRARGAARPDALSRWVRAGRPVDVVLSHRLRPPSAPSLCSSALPGRLLHRVVTFCPRVCPRGVRVPGTAVSAPSRAACVPDVAGGEIHRSRGGWPFGYRCGLRGGPRRRIAERRRRQPEKRREGRASRGAAPASRPDRGPGLTERRAYPRPSASSRGEPVGGREVLRHVLPSGERHLRAEPLVRAGRAALVEDRHLGEMDDLPPGLRACAGRSRSPRSRGRTARPSAPTSSSAALRSEHERADGPVAGGFAVVELEVEHPLAEPRGAKRQAVPRRGSRRASGRHSGNAASSGPSRRSRRSA